jgi:aldose 1-epimerase
MHPINVKSILALFVTAISLLQLSAAEIVRFEESDFGKTPDGTVVKLYTLRNSKGMVAKVMTYGATLTELQTPDRNGAMTSVVLGATTFEPFLRGLPAASVIGRVANRISKASFTLDGVDYKLAANNGPNSIHGGNKGFASQVWTGRALPVTKNETSVELTYVSKDGEEGYPGTCTVKVTYTLTEKNELRLVYEATTDKATIINLTNHAYFNLNGEGNVHDYLLTINSDKSTVADAQLIPTGEIIPVKGTALDFTKPTPIGANINAFKPAINGYDHNFILRSGGGKLALAARVSDPKSGRIMEVSTTQPGLQIYTGNHLNPAHKAVCFETQHYPDSIHQPSFPSIVLRPGKPYKETTVFAFSAK